MIGPEQQRIEVLGELDKAVHALAGSLSPGMVSGTNIGYAIRGARDGTGVAAVTGGFTIENGTVRPLGPCTFSADPSVTRIVLTAAKFDPAMRSAAIIPYSDAAAQVIQDMFLECCAIDRRTQPPGIETMDWGVASCCKDGVPEVIVDRGLTAGPGRIYLFGETPEDVAGNIIMLSNRITHTEL